MMCLLSRFKACTICKIVGTCTTLVLAQTNVKSVLLGVGGGVYLLFLPPQWPGL